MRDWVDEIAIKPVSTVDEHKLIVEVRRLRDVVADQKAYIAAADDVRGKLTKTLDERTNCLMDLHELLVDTREQLESYEI